MATKATGTLAKRANSLVPFGRWSSLASGVGAFALPFTEGKIYQYLKPLAAEKAPPTRAQSFVEAVKFTRGALGLHADLGELLSSRVNGAAFQA